jgi:hypothetical protein
VKLLNVHSLVTTVRWPDIRSGLLPNYPANSSQR